MLIYSTMFLLLLIIDLSIVHYYHYSKRELENIYYKQCVRFGIFKTTTIKIGTAVFIIFYFLNPTGLSTRMGFPLILYAILILVLVKDAIKSSAVYKV